MRKLRGIKETTQCLSLLRFLSRNESNRHDQKSGEKAKESKSENSANLKRPAPQNQILASNACSDWYGARSGEVTFFEFYEPCKYFYIKNGQQTPFQINSSSDAF
jgi:hypothetical protein